MWKCKKCGSTKITCNAKGTYFGYSVPNENGIADTSQIDISDITFDENDVYTDLYWCENCMTEEKDINKLADWINLKKVYFKDLKAGMILYIDDEKYKVQKVTNYKTVELRNIIDNSYTSVEKCDFNSLHFYIEV